VNDELQIYQISTLFSALQIVPKRTQKRVCIYWLAGIARSDFLDIWFPW